MLSDNTAVDVRSKLHASWLRQQRTANRFPRNTDDFCLGSYAVNREKFMKTETGQQIQATKLVIWWFLSSSSRQIKVFPRYSTQNPLLQSELEKLHSSYFRPLAVCKVCHAAFEVKAAVTALVTVVQALKAESCKICFLAIVFLFRIKSPPQDVFINLCRSLNKSSNPSSLAPTSHPSISSVNGLNAANCIRASYYLNFQVFSTRYIYKPTVDTFSRERCGL